jgi:hypothetical protein
LDYPAVFRTVWKHTNREKGMEKEADILSRKEAAAFLGICLSTLDRLDIPRIKIRDRVLYKREVLKKWTDEHTENKDGKKK